MRRFELISILVLFCAGIAIYAETLGFGFVWDDHFLIRRNPQMADLGSVVQFFTRDFWQNSILAYDSGLYRPLTLTSFLLDHRLGGGAPFAFHLTSVLLHCANAALVLRLLLAATQRKLLSLASAVLFLVHPLASEVVAFIADRGDLLGVFFLLLSCRFYLAARRGRRLGDVLSLASLGLAFLSKENAMVGVGLLVLLHHHFVSNRSLRETARAWPRFAPYIGLTVAFFVLRRLVLGGQDVMTQEYVPQVSVFPAFDAWSHLATAAEIFCLYLEMFFWPVRQSIAYVVFPPASLSSPGTLAAMACAVLVVAAALLLYLRGSRESSFGMLWFLATILPMTNLIPLTNAIAERYMYLPSIGLSVLVAAALAAIRDAWPAARAVRLAFYGMLVIVALALSWKTAARNQVWRDDGSLFASALDTWPCSSMGHWNVSAYWNQRGDVPRAEEQYVEFQRCQERVEEEYARRRAQYLGA